MEVLKSFGLKCKELRNQRKLSQDKFALLIGMDRSYYAAVELGKRNISLSNIAKIAQGFGISLSAIFEDVEIENGEEERSI